MSLVIDDRDLKVLNMSADQIKIEIAVMFYEKGTLTLGQAAHFAGLNRIMFQKELGKREVATNYDANEFEKDLTTLNIAP